MNTRELPAAPARMRYIIAPAPAADIACESCDRNDATEVAAFAGGPAFYICQRCRP